MTVTVTTKIPIGQRLHNPLNLKKSPTNWLGKSDVSQHAIFETFDDPHHGIRAAARNLLTYYRRYKLRSVQAIVQRWAPPDDDNDTGGYISRVAHRMNVTPDAELDLEDPDVLGALIVAMMPEEIGSVPYSEETITTAVAAAYTGTRYVAPLPAPVPASPVPPPAAPGEGPKPPLVERPVPPLVDQPTGTPTRKVNAIPVGGVFAGIPLAFVIQALWNKALPESPMEVEVAIALAGIASTGCAYLFAYFTRNRASLPPPGTCA